MIRDNGEKHFKVLIRVQVVRFCSFYKAVDYCAGFCSMIGLDQHEVLPSDRKGTDGPLRRIVIHRDVAVAKELPEVLLLVDAVTKSFSDRPLRCHLGIFQFGCLLHNKNVNTSRTQKQFPQTKLVRVIRGTVYDAAVDLRKDSMTYGHFHGEILSDENRRQFLIPRGFAHGFLVLSDIAEFCYKCDDFYHPNDEGGLAWNDPEIGIKWPEVLGDYMGSADASGYTLTDGTPLILSEKDQKWLGIKNTFRF